MLVARRLTIVSPLLIVQTVADPVINLLWMSLIVTNRLLMTSAWLTGFGPFQSTERSPLEPSGFMIRASFCAPTPPSYSGRFSPLL